LLALSSTHATDLTCSPAPEGLERMGTPIPDDNVAVVTSAVDERRDQSSSIVHGLGDAGDRLFVTPPAEVAATVCS
jgi:uracil phosphoribosyltransferase